MVRRTLIASIITVLLAAHVAAAETYTGQTRLGVRTTHESSGRCTLHAGALVTDLVMRCATASAHAAARYDFKVPAEVKGVSWQVNWVPGTTHPGVTAAMTRPSADDVRVTVRAQGIAHADIATVVIEYYTK